MKQALRKSGVVVALLLLGNLARAENADAVARARTHFEAGRALYNLGNYTDAIREFSSGYQLAPRPQFLVNLGQAYRKLGDLEHARDMYKKFLDESPASDPDREQVRQILVEIEKAIAEAPPKPPPAPAAAPVVQNTAADNTLTASPPPPRRSFVRRNWWIFPVGGALVLGAVAVGIYFAARPAGQVDCAHATLGCIDGSGMK